MVKDTFQLSSAQLLNSHLIRLLAMANVMTGTAFANLDDYLQNNFVQKFCKYLSDLI